MAATRANTKGKFRKKQGKYFVYLLRCSDNSLYCGIAVDLKRRIRQHNGELARGAKYTRAKRPVQLAYSEVCKSLKKAMQREYEIKKWNKPRKEALLEKKRAR